MKQQGIFKSIKNEEKKEKWYVVQVVEIIELEKENRFSWRASAALQHLREAKVQDVSFRKLETA